MICPICGANNEDNVMFCAKCGAKMKNDDQASAAVQEEKGKGMAIASLITGILGLTLCSGWGIPNILAIIFAIVAKKKGSKSGMATAGLILGIIGVVLTIIGFILCLIYGASILALLGISASTSSYYYY